VVVQDKVQVLDIKAKLILRGAVKAQSW
jgi:hypothetical protein